MARSAAEDKGWVCVAAFAGAHGVRGEVRLKTFTAEPDAVGRFDRLHEGPAGTPYKVTLTRPIKGGYAARVEGVRDREAAQALSGQRLFVPRDALPTVEEDEAEDAFYLADLIGLEVVDPAGKRLGVVHAVPNYGAGDLVELTLDRPVKGLGRTALVPFERALVPTVDITGGRLVIDLAAWLEGQVDAPAAAGENDD